MDGVWSAGPRPRSGRWRLAPRTRRGRVLAGFLAGTLAFTGGAMAAWFTNQVLTDSGAARFSDVVAITGVAAGVQVTHASLAGAGTLSPGDAGKALKLSLDNQSGLGTLHVVQVVTRNSGLSFLNDSPVGGCGGVLNQSFNGSEYTNGTDGISTHSQLGLSIPLPRGESTLTIPGYVDVAAGISDTCAGKSINIPVTVTVGP